MFICDTCLKENYTNPKSWFRNFGRCESCGISKDCNDIRSKYLTPIMTPPILTEAEVDDSRTKCSYIGINDSTSAGVICAFCHVTILPQTVHLCPVSQEIIGDETSINLAWKIKAAQLGMEVQAQSQKIAELEQRNTAMIIWEKYGWYDKERGMFTISTHDCRIVESFDIPKFEHTGMSVFSSLIIKHAKELVSRGAFIPELEGALSGRTVSCVCGGEAERALRAMEKIVQGEGVTIKCRKVREREDGKEIISLRFEADFNKHFTETSDNPEQLTPVDACLVWFRRS